MLSLNYFQFVNFSDSTNHLISKMSDAGSDGEEYEVQY